MSYHRNRAGLSGAESCGPNQIYYPDVTFAGVKGQCMTAAQYNECKSTGRYAGQACTVAAATSGGTSWTDKLWDAAKSVVVAKVTPAPVYQQTTVAAPGMSTTTKIAIAGAAAVGLVLILRSRKK